MATPLLVTALDVGAPDLKPNSYASIINVLDWILVTKGGWSILQTDTNIRVYKMPGGSQRCLYINSTSTSVIAHTTGAEVRGCDNATSASYAGLVNPFPDDEQVPDAYQQTPNGAADSSIFGWLYAFNLSTTVNRFYAAWITDKWVRLWINQYPDGATSWNGTTSDRSENSFFFGDLVPAHAGDTWCTLLIGSAGYIGSSSYQTFNNFLLPYSSIFWNNNCYWARNRTGTLKSVQGQVSVSFGGDNCPALGVNYLGKLSYMPISVSCSSIRDVYERSNYRQNMSGPESTLIRGWFENTWVATLSGVWAEGVYPPFLVVDSSTTGTNRKLRFLAQDVRVNTNNRCSSWLIMEESDTWVLPT